MGPRRHHQRPATRRHHRAAHQPRSPRRARRPVPSTRPSGTRLGRGRWHRPADQRATHTNPRTSRPRDSTCKRGQTATRSWSLAIREQAVAGPRIAPKPVNALETGLADRLRRTKSARVVPRVPSIQPESGHRPDRVMTPAAATPRDSRTTFGTTNRRTATARRATTPHGAGPRPGRQLHAITPILYGFRPARPPGSAQSRRVRWQHLACECHLTNLRGLPLRNGGCPAGTRSLASAREYVHVYTGRGSRTVVTSEATLSHALASFGPALRPRSLATRRGAFSGSPQYARLP